MRVMSFGSSRTVPQQAAAPCWGFAMERGPPDPDPDSGCGSYSLYMAQTTISAQGKAALASRAPSGGGSSPKTPFSSLESGACSSGDPTNPITGSGPYTSSSGNDERRLLMCAAIGHGMDDPLLTKEKGTLLNTSSPPKWLFCYAERQ